MKLLGRLALIGWLCSLAVACTDEPVVEPPVVEPPVEVVPVSEISLPSSMLLLEEGRNALLKASVLPANATDKHLVWESADERIATVDDDGNVSARQAGQTVVRVTGDGGNKQAECTVVVVKKEEDETKVKRTVLVYISADNNLRSFALEDLKEMKVGMLSVNLSGMRLLVYVDTGDSPKLLELLNRDGTVSEATVKSYERRNSMGVAEMQEVFQDVFHSSRYESESYGLVFWSHCDGWIPYPVPTTRWIGQDTGEKKDNRMNIADFRAILSASAPHFDFLLFDGCFMQSVEVAYELRDFADYYIASPTETPGPGAPYDRIVPYMFKEGAAAEIAEAYFGVYEALYAGGENISNHNWTGGTSIAAIDLSMMEPLAGATRQLISTATVIEPQKLRPLVFDYDRRGSNSFGHIGYYDLKGMLDCLTVDGDAFAAWEAVYGSAMAYWNTTPMNYSQYDEMFSMSGANGMTHYIPSSTTVAALTPYRALEWYQAAGLDLLGW